MLLYIQHFYVSLHTVHAFFAQNKFVMRTGTSGYQFNETFQEDVSLKIHLPQNVGNTLQ